MNWLPAYLVNKPAAQHRLPVGYSWPIAEDFQPVDTKNPQLEQIRQIIFGSDPDAWFIQYRLQQLVPLVMHTPLKEIVTAQDPLTTLPEFTEPQTPWRFTEELQVTELNQLPGQLQTYGHHTADLHLGTCAGLWEVEIHTPESLRLRSQQGTRTWLSFLEIAIAEQDLSSRFDLPGSTLQAAVCGQPGKKWQIRALALPDSISELWAKLHAQIGPTEELAIFGEANTTDWQTLRAYWERTPIFAPRLAALLVAIALRTAEHTT